MPRSALNDHVALPQVHLGAVIEPGTHSCTCAFAGGPSLRMTDLPARIPVTTLRGSVRSRLIGGVDIAKTLLRETRTHVVEIEAEVAGGVAKPLFRLVRFPR